MGPAWVPRAFVGLPRPAGGPETTGSFGATPRGPPDGGKTFGTLNVVPGAWNGPVERGKINAESLNSRGGIGRGIIKGLKLAEGLNKPVWPETRDDSGVSRGRAEIRVENWGVIPRTHLESALRRSPSRRPRPLDRRKRMNPGPRPTPQGRRNSGCKTGKGQAPLEPRKKPGNGRRE